MWRRAQLPGYVEFVAYAPLDYGESLHVCGELPALGSGDPARGIRMVSSSSTFPVFRVSEPVAFFVHTEIKYRYAIMRGDEFHRWERSHNEETEEDEVWRRVILVPEILPPLEDGTPSRRLTVQDRIVTTNLLRWNQEEIANQANTDCSLSAISADSIAYHAKLKNQDMDATIPPRPKVSTIQYESFDFQGMHFSNSTDRESWYSQTLALWEKQRSDAISEHQRLTSLKSSGRQQPLHLDTENLVHPPEKVQSSPDQHRPSPTGNMNSPRSLARQQAATAALEAFIEEEAPPPSIESPPLTAADGVVVASLFLPVLIQRKEASWQIEWDLENLLALQAPLRVTRVGLARVPDDTTPRERQQLATTLRRSPWFCIAIFLDRDTYNLYYHTFCKGVLWPVFHNSLEVYGEKATPSVEFDDQPFEADDEPCTTPRPTEAASVAVSEDTLLEGAEPETQMEPGAVLQAVASASELKAAVEAATMAANEEDEKRDRNPSLGAFSDPGDDENSENEEYQPQTEEKEEGTGETPPKPERRKAHFKRVTRIERAWRAYKRVNQIFREHVVEAYNEGDLIWIHGFQLALLPAFVSRRLTVAKVGLFLHTPFPSSEIFRTLSMRNELIRGILSADQVGFHLYEYARHFLTTARRLVGARYSYDSRGPVINVDGREVVVSCIHAAVEPADLADVASTPAGIRAVQRLRAELNLLDEDDPTSFDVTPAINASAKRTRIIAGIDKLERLRGLPLKLLAYEKFLDARKKRLEEKQNAPDDGGVEETKSTDATNDDIFAGLTFEATDEEGIKAEQEALHNKIINSVPDYGEYTDDNSRVVLVQYVLSSVERNEDCDRTRGDSESICERIRAKHGHDCLVWREVPVLKIVDRLALLKLADVFWVSSVRDGLNRWPIEYIAMQSDNLLGIERHAAAFARTPNAESFTGTTGNTVGVADYFSDTMKRMLNACGGPGIPQADPCTIYQPKFMLWLGHKLRKRELVRKVIEELINSGHDTNDARQAAIAATSAAMDSKEINEKELVNAYFAAQATDDDYIDLADETFPSLQDIDEDEYAAELDESTALNIEGEPLYRPKDDEGPFYNDYLADVAEDRMRDAKGDVIYLVHSLIRRALGRKARRVLRTYLQSSTEAQRQHAARHARCRSRRMGALLLSENASTTRVLLGSVSVNPWRIDDSAQALEKLLGMRCRERMARHAIDAEYLSSATTAKWAYRVLHDLKALNKDANHLNATHAGLGLNFRVLGMRSGFDALQVQPVARAYRDFAGGRRRKSAPTPKQKVRPVSVPPGGTSTTPPHAGQKYERGFFEDSESPSQQQTSRIIVLDYGGTLVPDTAAADSVAAYEIAHGERRSPTPSAEVKSALITLATDPSNIVFVVSGRERADLLDSLGDVLSAAPDLGLAAEHGFFVRWPRALRTPGASATGRDIYSGLRPQVFGHDDATVDDTITTRKDRSLSSGDGAQVNTSHDEWERPFSALNDERLAPWRNAVLSTMDMFAQRTQGTYIEKHESSLVWQFRDADPDYGEMQAKELEHQLGLALETFTHRPQVLRGENPSRGGYVEVRPSGVDKGAFLSRLLRSLSAAGRPASFALVVGDDESDEPMFRSLSQWIKDRDSMSAYSVTIGKKPSEANAYVDSHDSLLEILQALARVSSRASRHHSALDLSGPSPFAPSSLVPDVDPTPEEFIDPMANGGKITTSNFLSGVRSLSMPVRSLSLYRSLICKQAIAQPLPTHQHGEESRPEKVPSWMTLEEGLPGAEQPLEQVIESENPEDEAAMFF